MTSKNDKFDLDLIPDPEIARQLGVTLMTIWRWDHSPEMGFPKRIKINTRNYRSASDLAAWRDKLVRQSVRDAKKAARS